MKTLARKKTLERKTVETKILETVCCPNCGSPAERRIIQSQHLSRLACPICDYFMVSDIRTGQVIEAYAPGIVARV